MIDVVAHGAGLAGLDQGLRGAAAEGGDRLGAVPGQGLGGAAGPVLHQGDDLQHLADAGLRLGAVAAAGLLEDLPGKAGGFGELGL